MSECNKNSPVLGADLVTQYDRAVENMISSSLKEKYPNYA